MYTAGFINDPMFYNRFTIVQFQRSATKEHLALFNHYIANIKKKVRVPLTYEIDDALIDIPKWNYAFNYYEKNINFITDIMKQVDGITVTTQPLKDMYSPYNNNIGIIPNHLPKFLWGDILEPRYLRVSKGKIRIGWAGSENHFSNPKSKDFSSGIYGGDFGSELLSFIHKTVDIYTWVICGALPVELYDIKDKIEFHKFVPIINYPQFIKSMDLDICIAPLMPCKFNDCKCLVGNTKVISDRGIMQIKDVDNSNSLYQNNSFERVESNIVYSNKEVIKVITDKGYSISGTPNHRIFYNGKYVRLDELCIGNKIDISFFEYPDLSYVNVLDFVLDEKWGYFIGLFLGERWSNENIGVCTFRWLLNKFGFNKNIPEQIWRSPKSVVKEFIKGLFDSDSVYSYDGVYFISKNRQLVEDIQFLLLGFSIISRVSSSDKNYILYLDRCACNIFYKEIGFRCIAKQEELAKICSVSLDETLEMKDEIVSIQYGINDVYDVEIPNNHFYVANGFISHNSNIKALEYTFIGCPGVYSNVYPYKDMTLTSDDDYGMINYIEKLARDVNFREEVYNKDLNIVKDQMFWEGFDGSCKNLRDYVNTYLGLFGKSLKEL